MEIITDAAALRTVSEDVNAGEAQEIIAKLRESLTDTAIGLAAPQIGINKRAFLAKVDGSWKAFINPVVENLNEYTAPSTESCLSIPGVTRCVTRNTYVRVTCSEAYTLQDEFVPCSNTSEYAGRNAAIIQHENDHLNGILLIDLKEVSSEEEKIQQKEADRKARIARKRDMKPKKTKTKMNAKKAKALDAHLKQYAKQQAKSEWIQRMYQQQLSDHSQA